LLLTGPALPATAQIIPLSTPGALAWGQEVRAIGDLNLDGIRELAVGAPATNGGLGLVDILDGAAPTAPPLLSFQGRSPGDGFGWAIARGDVNGDGFPDLLVSAPFEAIPGAATSAGSVTAFDGMALTAIVRGLVPPSTPTTLWVKCAPTGVSSFGFDIDTGDVDGNGSIDIVISAPSSESFFVVYPSFPFTPHPASGVFEPPTRYTVSAPAPTSPVPANFGWAVSAAGDLSGDGVADIAIGAPTAFGTGVAYNFRVDSAQTPAPIMLINGTPGAAAGDRFGFDLDIAGNFNAIGARDLVVGAPGTGVLAPGMVYILAGVSLTPIYPPLVGPIPGGGFGWSVSGISDRTGDGLPDLVAGAPFAPDPIAGTGGIMLIDGSTGLAVPTPALAPLIYGSAVGLPAGSLSFGYSLARSGVTPGGIPGILVGAPGSNAVAGAAARL
jgi:hypothetical protein